ncbi:hypothetical protein ACSZND_13410 [Aeromonas hydrophila]|nr:hypothetical protein [Aeromonas hydrophila]MCX4106092.1 hypothetical protein [Aeromonas hydrophila]
MPEHEVKTTILAAVLAVLAVIAVIAVMSINVGGDIKGGEEQ